MAMTPVLLNQPPGAFSFYSQRTTGFTVSAIQLGTVFDCSGTSFAVTAAPSLGAGFQFEVYASGSNTYTVTASSGTIQGPAGSATTLALTTGQGAVFESDGTNWKVVSAVGLPSSGPTAINVADTLFTVFDDADNTKKFQFQASTITTGNTRIYSVPDATTTLAALGVAQTFTAAQTFSATINVTDAINVALGTTTGTKFGTSTSQKIGFFNATPVVQQSGDVGTALSTLGLVVTPTLRATSALDGTFAVQNTADNTKQFKWALGGMTTGIVITIASTQSTAQQLNIPNITTTDTLVTTALAQTIAGAKTFSAITAVSNATASTSPTTGALQVAGGVGIGGALNVSGTTIIGTDPGGSDPFRVNGNLTISSAILLSTKTTMTNFSGASAGTLLNAPTAGNPTKWIAFNDNGTNRFIPCW